MQLVFAATKYLKVCKIVLIFYLWHNYQSVGNGFRYLLFTLLSVMIRQKWCDSEIDPRQFIGLKNVARPWGEILATPSD